MKIALIGYGNMGRSVERAARERGHSIVGIFDIKGDHTLTPAALVEAEVAIDFSSAAAVLDTTHICVVAGVPIVVGTTGWSDSIDDVRRIVEKDGRNDVGFLWSPNFSIGVYMYLKIVAYAAQLADGAEEYDVWGHEIHHSGKADSPSGTAKALETILLAAIKRKKTVVEEKLDRKREDSEIHFSSVRGGPVNFGHTIAFDSAADRILLTHEARSRDGYALGAVKAAEWLRGRKGFFSMDDYMRDVLHSEA